MIDKILAAEELLASRVAYTFRTYPKQITAAIAAMLMCAGGGAFAVAFVDDGDLVEEPVVLLRDRPFVVDDQVDDARIALGDRRELVERRIGDPKPMGVDHAAVDEAFVGAGVVDGLAGGTLDGDQR